MAGAGTAIAASSLDAVHQDAEVVYTLYTPCLEGREALGGSILFTASEPVCWEESPARARMHLSQQSVSAA